MSTRWDKVDAVLFIRQFRARATLAKDVQQIGSEVTSPAFLKDLAYLETYLEMQDGR